MLYETPQGQHALVHHYLQQAAWLEDDQLQVSFMEGIYYTALTTDWLL